jgi:hypothetical protein
MNWLVWLTIWLVFDLGFVVGLWWAQRVSTQRSAQMWAEVQARIAQQRERDAALNQTLTSCKRGWDMPPSDHYRLTSMELALMGKAVTPV